VRYKSEVTISNNYFNSHPTALNNFEVLFHPNKKVLVDRNIFDKTKRIFSVLAGDTLKITNNVMDGCTENPEITLWTPSSYYLLANNVFANIKYWNTAPLLATDVINNVWIDTEFDSFCFNCPNDNSKPVNVKNNIFWNNRLISTNTLPGTTWTLPFPNDSLFLDHNIFDFSATDLLPARWALGSNNLFNQYPEFIDTTIGNYRLGPCSPAYNAGDSAAIALHRLTCDVSGQGRVNDGLPDIGAYESAPLSTAAPIVVQPNCPPASSGAIEWSVAGGCDSVGFQWERAGVAGTGLLELSGGNYSITATDSKGRTLVAQVVVPESEWPGTTEFQVLNATCDTCHNGAITFGGSTSGVALQWSTGDVGSMVSGVPAGNYSCVLTDTLGCTRQYEFTVGVTVGTYDPSGWSVRVWPNPFSGHLYVDLPSGEAIRWQLYSLTGQLEGEGTIVQRQLVLEDLPAGTYTLLLQIGARERKAYRVIRQ
jgi:hypothetical protein